MTAPTLPALLRPFKPPCLLPLRKRILWTRPHMVRPAYVKRKFGDGKLLLALTPIMHRPWYYLLWVDSKMDLEHDEAWLDQLDEVCDRIGDEFGTRERDDNGDPEPRYRWPEEDSSGGCAWWKATAEDILPPLPILESA